MIESAAIFTKGGILLWFYTFNPFDAKDAQQAILTHFVQKYIIEEKTANTGTYGSLNINWTLLNNLSVVIVVIYDHFKNIQDFLEALKDEFLKMLPESILTVKDDYTYIQTSLLDTFPKTSFDKVFLDILDRCEKYVDTSAHKRPKIKQKKKGETKPQKDSSWSAEKKVTLQAMNALDYSTDKNLSPQPSTEQIPISSYTSATAPKQQSTFWNKIVKKLHNSITSVTGNQLIEDATITPVLEEFKNSLIAKNVATDVAQQIVDSVSNSLSGTKTASFSSLKSTVYGALSDSICRILCQSKSIDLHKSILETRELGQIYSICFLGINGVGKSTNLAKVAYYLKNKANLKVMMAACDTFRSGAIEQLRTHARNLDVALFEQGYGKDPAMTCKQALKEATKNDVDVVLIDTAGRMQDNEPLMQALAKLVHINNPNLILFVGEALVGNDSVDQLSKFNKCLLEYGLAKSPREIDALLLTKFDTVDDKVGATLTMTYVSGKPILFVGTGQNYGDLQPFQMETILDCLIN